MTAEELIELIATEAIVKHAEIIKQFCEEHKNCRDCAFYNGACRFNNLPTNWDIYITKS